ncbi:hypothetical protein [Laspinema olomoucense]|nr:hypothetical protein [Laspinema sp. D3c]MCT7984999.1 hypothetical protein [Laspinema sp. D2d]MCT7996233.1 hypothetical protein [Laspinema sp. D3c]
MRSPTGGMPFEFAQKQVGRCDRQQVTKWTRRIAMAAEKAHAGFDRMR